MSEPQTVDAGHAVKPVQTWACSDCGRDAVQTADGFAHLETTNEKYRREEQERRDRVKADKAERRAGATPYRGRIKRCMSSVTPGRGAPYRCSNERGLVVVRDYRTGLPMVACATHAGDPSPSVYSGWGGDPNPRMPVVEPEYHA